MIYTTGSIVRIAVRDTGEILVGVVVRLLDETVLVAARLQVSGGRLVYSREAIGEVIEVIDGPDHESPVEPIIPVAPTVPDAVPNPSLMPFGAGAFGGVLTDRVTLSEIAAIEGEDGA